MALLEAILRQALLALSASIGVTLDMHSHVMPGTREKATEKIDPGLRLALTT